MTWENSGDVVATVKENLTDRPDGHSQLSPRLTADGKMELTSAICLKPTRKRAEPHKNLEKRLVFLPAWFASVPLLEFNEALSPPIWFFS